MVLGSGLGGFADELTDRVEIPYSEIPGWPRSTAVGHAGKLVFGKIGSVDLAVLSGRAHLYEGYSACPCNVRDADFATAGREIAGIDERCRRNQFILATGRAGADQRSHQSARV